MNEKTKKILRYVACGLGGLALGIGLLGGLSMCATSNRSTDESVNTIYSSPKRAQITTTRGGYTGYQFSIDTEYPTIEDRYSYRIYRLGSETYTPIDSSLYTGTLEGNDWSYTISMIDTAYAQGRTYQTENTSYRFLLAFWAYSNPWPTTERHYRQIAYITFIEPAYASATSGFSNADTAFVLTNNSGWDGKISINYPTYSALGSSGTFFSLTNSKTSFFCYGKDLEDSTLTFQDVKSYYKELGYQDGETSGYNSGYAEGYEDGAGNSLLFTKIGANQTAWSRSDITWDDSTDTTSTMNCLDFKDGENNTYYVSLVDYTIGGGEVQVNIYKNGTASNNFFATIGRGTYNTAYTEIDIIPSSYLEFEFAQVITYYHNAIPNNWFMLSGTPANANGYQQGYQAGFKDGQLSTPSGQATNNVFALFTQAFNSVGGIFELKVFGFLPLYWFFLTPIFIAIITLLLRMVKH